MKGNAMENVIMFAVCACALPAGACVIGYGTYDIAADGSPVLAGVCAGVNWALAILVSVYNFRRGK